MFSSPVACGATIANRLKKLSGVQTPEAEADRHVLEELAAVVQAITPECFSRYQTLLELLRPRGKLDWHPEKVDDRQVIFTERVETLKVSSRAVAARPKVESRANSGIAWPRGR